MVPEEGAPTNDGANVPLPVLDDQAAQPADDRNEVDGVALCLSGGGYRAMVFHLGALIRINEIGQLKTLARVSSVSGGSITAGVLGMAWSDLTWDGSVATNLDSKVIEPILKLATKTIDRSSILTGLALPFWSIGNSVAATYNKHLFDGATLQDLPSDDVGPRFIINATNVSTGKLFRFSRPYQGDWSVGLWMDPMTTLADAVTASSAFPPVLSPHVIEASGVFDPETIGPNAMSNSIPKRLWLSDGGVYDNLGLETAFKRYRTVLVSDGGGQLDVKSKPHRNWAQHSIRVAGIVDGQVRALRKRQLLDLFSKGYRTGTYWGIRSDVVDYGLATPLAIPDASRDSARGVPTRLMKLDDMTLRALVNWGYVIADTALRRWVFPGAANPNGLPLSVSAQ